MREGAYKIRQLRPAEMATWAKKLKNADRKCFPGDRRHKFEGRTWVLLKNGELAGYACTKSLCPHTAFLDRYGILERHRGQGLQTKLLKSCLDHHRKGPTKRVVTYTTTDNVKSTNSLLRMGFKPYWPRAVWASRNVVYLILRNKPKTPKKSCKEQPSPSKHPKGKRSSSRRNPSGTPKKPSRSLSRSTKTRSKG